MLIIFFRLAVIWNVPLLGLCPGKDNRFIVLIILPAVQSMVNELLLLSQEYLQGANTSKYIPERSTENSHSCDGAATVASFG